jgi:hypothetical protein
MCPVGHHQGSLLFDRLTISHTSTCIACVSHQPPLLYQPPLLHQQYRCPRVQLLFLQWHTSTLWAPVPRAATRCPPSTTPCLSLQCQRPSIALLLTPIGEPLWRKNTVLSCRTTPRISCLVLLGPMLSLGSGSSSTNFSLMAPSSSTKHVGFFVALPSDLVWILMRPSILW